MKYRRLFLVSSRVMLCEVLHPMWTFLREVGRGHLAHLPGGHIISGDQLLWNSSQSQSQGTYVWVRLLPCPALRDTHPLTALFTKGVRCADFYWQYGWQWVLCVTGCTREGLVYTSVWGWSCCALWGGRKVCAGSAYYSSISFSQLISELWWFKTCPRNMSGTFPNPVAYLLKPFCHLQR